MERDVILRGPRAQARVVAAAANHARTPRTGAYKYMRSFSAPMSVLIVEPLTDIDSSTASIGHDGLLSQAGGPGLLLA